MEKSTLQDLVYRIEGYGDTQEYEIKQYRKEFDGTIYLTLRRIDKKDGADISTGNDDIADDEKEGA